MTLHNEKKIVVRKLASHTAPEVFTVKEDEQLVLVLVAFEATTYRVTVELVGKQAQANIFGFLVGRRQDAISIHTTQQHKASHTLSDLHIKSALFDQSMLTYEGSIRIEKTAQQSNAYQRNDNLLLSDGAKAESKPALEILANEVRCTHGATLGKIDPEQLFYLESRGLPIAQAKKIIIEGFFLNLLERIPDVTVKKRLTRSLFATI